MHFRKQVCHDRQRLMIGEDASAQVPHDAESITYLRIIPECNVVGGECYNTAEIMLVLVEPRQGSKRALVQVAQPDRCVSVGRSLIHVPRRKLNRDVIRNDDIEITHANTSANR